MVYTWNCPPGRWCNVNKCDLRQLSNNWTRVSLFINYQQGEQVTMVLHITGDPLKCADNVSLYWTLQLKYCMYYIFIFIIIYLFCWTPALPQEHIYLHTTYNSSQWAELWSNSSFYLFYLLFLQRNLSFHSVLGASRRHLILKIMDRKSFFLDNLVHLTSD